MINQMKYVVFMPYIFNSCKIVYNKSAIIPILSAERKDGYYEHTAEQDYSALLSAQPR